MLLLLAACAAPTPETPRPTPGTTETSTTETSTTGSPPLPADWVLVDADVVTLDDASSRADALAVRDGVIVWVGAAPIPEALLGPDTAVHSAGGRQVLPGLIDVHAHLLEAFHPSFTCTLDGYGMLQSHQAALTACAALAPVGTDWVVGWGFDLWSALGSPGTPRRVLDQAIPDRPAVIMENSSHAAWVNSVALAALGFDADTPDPAGGVILRDADGQPSGLLLDAAAEQAFDLAMTEDPSTPPLAAQALRDGLAAAAQAGITAVGDGRCYWKRGWIDAWEDADAAGELTLRAVVPLWAYPSDDDDAQLAALKALRSASPSGKLRFDQIKLYADGLAWITTGAMLEPYSGPQLAGPTGLAYFEPDRLTRYVTELEQAGFDMHIHAIGDRGVRQALDAIGAARAADGDLGARHRITHVELVAPEDVPRFRELDVTADIQLSGWWTAPEHLHDNDFVLGAARVDTRMLRVRDLYDAGARVVLSSDYDVGPLSPFVSVANAIDRGDQSLPDVEAALRAMTRDAAWVLRLEDEVGSLEVGKRADLVVIDRDLWAGGDLAATRVLWTISDGAEVWRDPSFTP